MTKITIPIPSSMMGDKQYAIKFDSDHIVGIGLRRGVREVPSDKPYIVREQDGTTELRLKFEGNEQAPKWVEMPGTGTLPEPCHYCNVLVVRGPNGTIHASHPRHPSPWVCFGNSDGYHVIPKLEVHE